MSRIVCGINPVMETLTAQPKKVKKIYYSRTEKGPVKEIIQKGKTLGIEISACNKEELARLSENINHQGILAQVSDFHYASFEELIHCWKKSDKKAFFLVLDNMQDPHNLGAIIRTAETVGIDGIIIPKDRSVSITAAVEKVSAGAVEHVKIARVTNIAQTLKALNEEGVWVAGAEGGGAKSLFETDLNMDLALVIGSEGKGIRPLVKKQCHFLLSIPMQGKINSLNASVAAAIIMYEITRQRYAT